MSLKDKGDKIGTSFTARAFVAKVKNKKQKRNVVYSPSFPPEQRKGFYPSYIYQT